MVPKIIIPKRRVSPWLILSAVLFLTILRVALFGDSGLGELYKKWHFKQGLEEKVKIALEKNVRLKTRVAELKDPNMRALAALARKRNFVRDDEIIYVISGRTKRKKIPPTR